MPMLTPARSTLYCLFKHPLGQADEVGPVRDLCASRLVPAVPSTDRVLDRAMDAERSANHTRRSHLTAILGCAQLLQHVWQASGAEHRLCP